MSNNQINLKYGEGDLNLQKSKELIAIKKRSNDIDLSPSISRLLDNELSTDRMGSFEIISLGKKADDLENLLNTIRRDSSVVIGTHVFHTSDDGVPFIPNGQIYIEFHDNASDEECQALLDKYKLSLLEARGAKEFIVEVTPESVNPIKTSVELQKSPLIKIAEPDLITPVIQFSSNALADDEAISLSTMGINDSLLKEQWHLNNTGFHRGTRLGLKAGADARVVKAWQLAKTLGSSSTIVAVIDDGFDLGHSDLSGPGKIVAPWDFSRYGNNPQPDYGDWHGTACAGVAVGNINNAGSIVGAAPGCRLMPIRWGRSLSDYEIENWFNYVKRQGAAVASCSWGAAARYFPLSTRMNRAIRDCALNGRNGLGTVICFAAGNSNHDIDNPADGTKDGFATHPNVIAVAASNSLDQRSNYSNFGRNISVCAPSSGAGGWGIVTSDVRDMVDSMGNRIQWGYDSGNYTLNFGGTSSACPLVAGICALILSVKPSLNSQQVKDLIQRTARKIGSGYNQQGHSPYFGYGCINAEAAIRQVMN